MEILYFSWGENNRQDAIDVLKEIGHKVHVIAYRIQNYDEDPSLSESLRQYIEKEAIQLLFSFNYIPLLSKLCMQCVIPYCSWVYDSPHLTLYSKTLDNPNNHIYLFDQEQCRKLQQAGFTTVHHMPLGTNVKRLDLALSDIGKGDYRHDISFVGRMYHDETNFLDQISYIPEELRGYIDGLIEAQIRIYGYDFIEEVFDEAKVQELAKYVKIDLGKQYITPQKQIFADMIRKKITAIDRVRSLQAIGQIHLVDLYAPVDPEIAGVRFLGYADYTVEMPKVFRTSKINLNITLRSITSGIPLRAIDIMGAGGFLLTNYQPELEAYFTNGQELVWYDSQEDMVAKIQYYLVQEEEREAIARCGHQKIVEEFTYQNQFQKIMQEIAQKMK